LHLFHANIYDTLNTVIMLKDFKGLEKTTHLHHKDKLFNAAEDIIAVYSQNNTKHVNIIQ
jgi:hypothetical protein